MVVSKKRFGSLTSRTIKIGSAYKVTKDAAGKTVVVKDDGARLAKLNVSARLKALKSNKVRVVKKGT